MAGYATEEEVYQMMEESLRGILAQPGSMCSEHESFEDYSSRDDRYDDSMDDYELFGMDEDDCGGLDPWTANGMD